MTNRLTWRKDPNERGLARVCQSQRGLIGCINGKVVCHVACDRRSTGSWYWYGWSKNSLTEDKQFQTKELARDDAKAYYKANVREASKE